MVLASGVHEMVKQSLSKEKKVEHETATLFGISIVLLVRLVDLALVILALYFYFKCNFGKKSSVSDKVLGFLAACCCNVCYVAYHLAVPC